MVGDAEDGGGEGGGAEFLWEFSQGGGGGVEGGAGGADVVDEPEVFAGEVFVGAGGEGVFEVFVAVGGGFDFGLGVGGAGAAEGGADLPVCEEGGLAGEFVGLVEAAFGAAGPVEGDGDEEVDGGLGLLGDLANGVVEKGGEEFCDFPGAGELEAVDEGDEGFGEGADAGGAPDAGVALVAAMAFVFVVVVGVGADG